jgi:hypothetical protein
MTDEPFWDELGIAWQAASPMSTIPLDRMKAHFRLESMMLRAALVVGILAATAGSAVAAFTLGQAWRLAAWNFGARALAALIASGIMWIIVATLWPVRGSDDAASLSDFVDLGLARAVRGLLAVKLGFVGCAVVAVLGIGGTAIRRSSGHPPALSPAVDLAILAVCAIAIELDRRRLLRKRSRFVYLREALCQVR